ncbi:hypothetical protein TSAR_001726 [Trichomalopsis sarcophagae]|uniref:Ig-like domain-containing protein n=1 Tax=Trichomalopsis sarcophagae TaxID=543379 RepID=A0A232F673_9HYME|nr:hypothetical protein TSAR_001726 [Trichomalopsis sarcophagae]
MVSRILCTYIYIYTVNFYFFWLQAFVIGLKEVRIQTPFAVKKGDSTKLYCLYDTEGDPLYIVKWYKSGREFYRYVPREQPSTKSFPVGNLRIKVR